MYRQSEIAYYSKYFFPKNIQVKYFGEWMDVPLWTTFTALLLLLIFTILTCEQTCV